jgi:hypothetical protein
LIYQLLPSMFDYINSKRINISAVWAETIVIVISPLNALTGDQIDKLKLAWVLRQLFYAMTIMIKKWKVCIKYFILLIFLYIIHNICIDPLPFCVFWQANLYEALNRAYGDMYWICITMLWRTIKNIKWPV